MLEQKSLVVFGDNLHTIAKTKSPKVKKYINYFSMATTCCTATPVHLVKMSVPTYWESNEIEKS